MGNNELLSWVRAALAPVSNGNEKRMFGRCALMVRGKLNQPTAASCTQSAHFQAFPDFRWLFF